MARKRPLQETCLFFRDPDSDDFVWCWSESGETYEVSKDGCECPHFFFTQMHYEASCRHCDAWREWKKAKIPLLEFSAEYRSLIMYRSKDLEEEAEKVLRKSANPESENERREAMREAAKRIPKPEFPPAAPRYMLPC